MSAGLSWHNDSLASASVMVRLGAEALAELERQRASLVDTDSDLPSKVDAMLPAFARAIETLRTGRIENAPGFCVIDGADLQHFSLAEIRALFSLISARLGGLCSQNARGDTIVEVYDRGGSLAAGGRYHQTDASGVLHSDSPQWPRVPDYVALLCVRVAKRGGESKFISAYAVHERLKATAPDLLDVLYAPFFFDKRGDFAAGEEPVIAAPVFSVTDGSLSFRYLRDYIASGHTLMGQPLSTVQVRALDALDAVLSDESLVVSLAMRPGDIQLLNNHFVVHDRRPFEDYNDESLKRLMLRAWIRRD